MKTKKPLKAALRLAVIAIEANAAQKDKYAYHAADTINRIETGQLSWMQDKEKHLAFWRRSRAANEKKALQLREVSEWLTMEFSL